MYFKLLCGLAINVDAREKFFDWIIETFPKFSIFIPKNNNVGNYSAELASFEINYIPTGFGLVNRHKGHNMLIYNYETENNQRLDIRLFSSNSKGQSYYDTENIEIEEFILKKSNAYMWKIDGITYLIWYQDGIECNISGNVDKDEAIKIAENILVKNH